MNVIVTGRDSYKRRLIECQVHWLVGYLGLSKSKLSLELVPRPGLRTEFGAGGLTGRRDDTIGMAIDINIPVPYIFNTVAHEMIHVKQLAKGQLKYEMKRGKEIAVWCGRKYEGLDYYDKPWEKEAFSKSELLARRFSDAIDKTLEQHERKRKI